MSFGIRNYSAQQMSIINNIQYMSDRDQRALKLGWPTMFFENITSQIDQDRKFSVLYSDNAASRPSVATPVLLGAEILAAMRNEPLEEVIAASRFDPRYKVALGVENDLVVPGSLRTHQRFQERVRNYEAEHGVNLIMDEVNRLSASIASTTIQFAVEEHAIVPGSGVDVSGLDQKQSELIKQVLNADGNTDLMGLPIETIPCEGGHLEIKLRADSLMFCGCMQVLNRQQLFYKVNQRLILACVDFGIGDLVEKPFGRYLNKDDYNAFLYSNKELSGSKKLQILIDESISLLDTVRGHGLDDTPDFQNVERVLEEQTVEKSGGKGRRPRTKEDPWPKGVLQNPTDPDATYRRKANKDYRGYSGSFMQVTVSFVPDNKDEEATVYPSIVLRSRVDQNNVDDSVACEKMIETLPEQPVERNLHADGAYTGESLTKTAKAKNIVIRNSDLKGLDVPDALADISFDDSGKICGCPLGIIPWDSELDPLGLKAKATFPILCCQSCMYAGACKATFAPTKGIATIHVKLSSVERAKQQRWISSEEGIDGGRYRNGVECLMSLLRRYYGIDRLGVRGLELIRPLVYFMQAAINIKQLFRLILRKKGISPRSLVV